MTRHRCFFARFDPTGRPCWGVTDKCHLLPKQRLKRLLGDDPLVIWDERLLVDGCRFHHGQFDNSRFKVPREALPIEVDHFAQEHGIEWMVDRDFGQAETAA